MNLKDLYNKFNSNVLVFRYLFYISCLSVCLYQIIKICEIYFSYKTTTFVNYDNFLVISLPAITICFDKIDVLRDDYRKHLNIKDNTNDDENELVKQYLANYTITEQLDMLLN